MKVIISGYGRMGHIVEKELERQGIELVEASEDICAIPREVARECVCIDFTTPDAFRRNYPVLAENFKAVVVGTTGWNDIRDEVIAAFERCGTPMIHSSNYSLGVMALLAGAARIGEVLRGKGYTPSITETHHIHKLDAPSGTARSLAGVVADSIGAEPEITSVREGEVAGIHTLVLASGVDRITLTHEAFSREGFAVGAVFAARLTEGLSGVHEFRELVL